MNDQNSETLMIFTGTIVTNFYCTYMQIMYEAVLAVHTRR